MNLSFETVAKTLIGIGIILIIVFAIIFSWNELDTFSFEKQINENKLGSLGSLISGIVGSVWALAGVILFYIALKEQRDDVQLNREALKLQIAALDHQVLEFQHQTQELEETRKVFVEQTKTQQLQRFESTFFQLVNLHHEIVNNLTKTYERNYDKIETSGRTIFETIKQRLNQFTEGSNSGFKHEKDGSMIPTGFRNVKNVDDVKDYMADRYYSSFYSEYEDTLNHYFRNLYHIFKYVHMSALIEDSERKFYANIMRSQLSQGEMYIIMFNSLIEGYGFPKFTFLLKEYNILKNFNSDNIPNEHFFKYFETFVADTRNPF